MSGLFPITTNPGTSVVAYFQVPNNGIYLFTWQIQATYTVLPTWFYSNISNGSTSTTTTPAALGVTNWGYTLLGLIGGTNYIETTGSVVIQTTANNYYNLLLYMNGTVASQVYQYNIARIA